MNNNIITFTINDRSGTKLFKVNTTATYNGTNISFFIIADNEEQVHARLRAGAVYDYLTEQGKNLICFSHELVQLLFGASYTLTEVK